MTEDERRSESLADQRARIAETVSTPAGTFLTLIDAEGKLREEATFMAALLRPAPAELQGDVYRSGEMAQAWAEFEARAVPYLDTLVQVRDLLLDSLRSEALPGSYYVQQRQHVLNEADSFFYWELTEARIEACGEVSQELANAAYKHFRSLNAIYSMDDTREGSQHDEGEPWVKAELLAADFLSRLGSFSDVRPTRGGADAGLDLAGRLLVAQVKYLSKPVGRPELQRLVGANVEERLMACFSRAGFTAQAMDYAEQHDIALFDIELPDEVSPANDFAYAILRAR